MIKIKLFIFTFLMITNLSFALEKDRLISFLQEYNASNEKYNGKVTYAIEKGYADVAEFLILKGESIEQYNERYPLSFNPAEYKLASHLQNVYIKHPLITAIRKGHKAVALLLIQLGYGNKAEEYKIEYKKQFDASQEEIERKNAMYVAIEDCEDGYDIVLGLLMNDFDVNTNNNLNPLNKPHVKHGYEFLYQFNYVYVTPILQAITVKNLDIAQLLLEYGADVEKFSSSPYVYENHGYQYRFAGTPLQRAVNDNYLEGVVLLLSYGANPLNGSPSPLDIAIQKGYLDIVDVLSNTVLSDKHE